jgi:hypothetical protein
MIWGAGTLVAAIAPSQVRVGFVVYSKGLPGIRSFSAEPDLDVDSLPLAEPTPQTPPDYIATLVQLRNQARTTGVTVGPTPPPVDFEPIVFLQTIQRYEEQALKLGWIDSPGIASSLDAKLNAAQQAMQAGDNNTAVNILGALVNEVDAQAGKHLSSEAVALLKFNAQFLVSKIS